jgi:hypothetical protein
MITTCKSELNTAKQDKGELMMELNTLRAQISPEMVTDTPREHIVVEEKNNDNKKHTDTSNQKSSQVSDGKTEIESTDETSHTWPEKKYGGYGKLEKLNMCQELPKQILIDDTSLTEAEVSTPPPTFHTIHQTFYVS